MARGTKKSRGYHTSIPMNMRCKFTCLLILSLVDIATGLPKIGMPRFWPVSQPARVERTRDAMIADVLVRPFDSTYYPTGRTSSAARAAWEGPSEGMSYTHQQACFADHWEGSVCNIAYGNTMNSFACLDLRSSEAEAVVTKIAASLPPSAQQDYSAISVGRLSLAHTADGGASQLELEMATQRNHRNPQGSYLHWPVNTGMNYFIIIDSMTNDTDVPGVDPAPTPQRVRFWIAANVDRELTFSIMESRAAIWPQLLPNPPQRIPNTGLRVLSYNTWNTNPPLWLYQHSDGLNDRYTRYSERMDLLCDVITEANPGIIGFQEVRFDESLGTSGQHLQMKDLAKRLPGYQYAFVPAMSYYDPQQMRREEEGPAIASRYPIVHVDSLLLSRDVTDTRDVHQRLCLHAVVQVEEWGLVDVYSVHLSLLEKARNNSVVELWKYVKEGKGTTQILMGDFNAEPAEPAIQFLIGNIEMDGEKTDFVDTWLALHPEPTPRSNSTHEQDEMLTFPSDKPSKRIDFIFVRGIGSTAVRKTWLVGQTPKVGVGRENKKGEDHLGMTHRESKLWASDHRGLITELGQD